VKEQRQFCEDKGSLLTFSDIAPWKPQVVS
jgi:hypothetical protein